MSATHRAGQRVFDKQRILDLLSTEAMTQEQIRAAVREDKTLVKSVLGRLRQKGLIRYSAQDGSWRLVR